jgi:hypothetical protein
MPAPAYLEHIRRNAYLLWESAGRQYGNALDYWLQAERQVLAAVMETATPPAEAEPEHPEPQAPGQAATA